MAGRADRRHLRCCETPEATVRREAMEEAGCTLSHIVPACAYLVSPGCVDEKVSVFCSSATAQRLGNSVVWRHRMKKRLYTS